jgi:hypothetical protein
MCSKGNTTFPFLLNGNLTSLVKISVIGQNSFSWFNSDTKCTPIKDEKLGFS